MADQDFGAQAISRNEDNNAVGNTIFVQLSDGTTSIGVTGNALDVNIENATIAVTQSGTWILGANDGVDIGDVTVNNAGGAAAVNIQDGGNSITIDGTVSISGTVTVSATDLDIRDLTHVSDSVKVGDGTDFLAVNADGSINVNLVTTVLGDEFHVANTATAAANTASAHTVTASGGVMLVTSITVAGSGGVKYVVTNNAVQVMTGFLKGRDGDTQQIIFSPAVEVADGDDFVITRTNRQNVSNDVYSSVFGRQL